MKYAYDTLTKVKSENILIWIYTNITSITELKNCLGCTLIFFFVYSCSCLRNTGGFCLNLRRLWTKLVNNPVKMLLAPLHLSNAEYKYEYKKILEVTSWHWVLMTLAHDSYPLAAHRGTAEVHAWYFITASPFPLSFLSPFTSAGLVETATCISCVHVLVPEQQKQEMSFDTDDHKQ